MKDILDILAGTAGILFIFILGRLYFRLMQKIGDYIMEFLSPIIMFISKHLKQVMKK